MTDDEVLATFQRTVRRLDNWRGYFGDDEDSPTDDEVHEALQRARDALRKVEAVRAVHRGTGTCDSCGFLVPCPTVKVLDGEA